MHIKIHFKYFISICLALFILFSYFFGYITTHLLHITIVNIKPHTIEGFLILFFTGAVICEIIIILSIFYYNIQPNLSSNKTH